MKKGVGGGGRNKRGGGELHKFLAPKGGLFEGGGGGEGGADYLIVLPLYLNTMVKSVIVKM